MILKASRGMGWRRVRRVDQEFLPGGDRFSENHLYLSKGLAGRHTSPVIIVSRSPPHHALIKISSPKAAASVPLAITRLGPTANASAASPTKRRFPGRGKTVQEAGTSLGSIV
jgi:hypothetical protein